MFDFCGVLGFVVWVVFHCFGVRFRVVGFWGFKILGLVVGFNFGCGRTKTIRNLT